MADQNNIEEFFNVEWISCDICFLFGQDHFDDTKRIVATAKKEELSIIVVIKEGRRSVMFFPEENNDIRLYTFSLSEYPHINFWEIKQLLSLISYESKYGRKVGFAFDSPITNAIFFEAVKKPGRFMREIIPNRINGCGDCNNKVCITKYVCFTTNIETTKNIFQNGMIKYTDCISTDTIPESSKFIFFKWGNCLIGDLLLSELNNEDEDYNFGVHFYFKYKDLYNYSGAEFDGYNPVKIPEISNLGEILTACVIPKKYYSKIFSCIPENLQDIVYFIDDQDCQKIEDWVQIAYETMVENDI